MGDAPATDASQATDDAPATDASETTDDTAGATDQAVTDVSDAPAADITGDAINSTREAVDTSLNADDTLASDAPAKGSVSDEITEDPNADTTDTPAANINGTEDKDLEEDMSTHFQEIDVGKTGLVSVQQMCGHMIANNKFEMASSTHEQFQKAATYYIAEWQLGSGENGDQMTEAQFTAFWQKFFDLFNSVDSHVKDKKLSVIEIKQFLESKAKSEGKLKAESLIMDYVNNFFTSTDSNELTIIEFFCHLPAFETLLRQPEV